MPVSKAMIEAAKFSYLIHNESPTMSWEDKAKCVVKSGINTAWYEYPDNTPLKRHQMYFTENNTGKIDFMWWSNIGDWHGARIVRYADPADLKWENE